MKASHACLSVGVSTLIGGVGGEFDCLGDCDPLPLAKSVTFTALSCSAYKPSPTPPSLPGRPDSPETARSRVSSGAMSGLEGMTDESREMGEFSKPDFRVFRCFEVEFLGERRLAGFLCDSSGYLDERTMRVWSIKTVLAEEEGVKPVKGLAARIE